MADQSQVLYDYFTSSFEHFAGAGFRWHVGWREGWAGVVGLGSGSQVRGDHGLR